MAELGRHTSAVTHQSSVTCHYMSHVTCHTSVATHSTSHIRCHTSVMVMDPQSVFSRQAAEIGGESDKEDAMVCFTGRMPGG